MSFLERLDPTFWPRVQEYLCRSRCLDPTILVAGFRQRILGADRRSNAVFIVRSAEKQPAGAELLGIQPENPFRGMAPGSRKARGGFWIARQKPPSSSKAPSTLSPLSNSPKSTASTCSSPPPASPRACRSGSSPSTCRPSHADTTTTPRETKPPNVSSEATRASSASARRAQRTGTKFSNPAREVPTSLTTNPGIRPETGPRRKPQQSIARLLGNARATALSHWKRKSPHNRNQRNPAHQIPSAKTEQRGTNLLNPREIVREIHSDSIQKTTMALALGHLRAGRKQQMRSLVGAIPVHDTGAFLHASRKSRDESPRMPVAATANGLLEIRDSFGSKGGRFAGERNLCIARAIPTSSSDDALGDICGKIDSATCVRYGFIWTRGTACFGIPPC